MPDGDFSSSILNVDQTTGCPTYGGPSGFGTAGSACFAAAIGLETSNGEEISGLNSSQLSNIEFRAAWTLTQNTGASLTAPVLQAFVYYDAMLKLKANNVVEMFN